ncbi:hypothetical protein D3C72_1662760 [compost metagenome]
MDRGVAGNHPGSGAELLAGVAGRDLDDDVLAQVSTPGHPRHADVVDHVGDGVRQHVPVGYRVEHRYHTGDVPGGGRRGLRRSPAVTDQDAGAEGHRDRRGHPGGHAGRRALDGGQRRDLLDGLCRAAVLRLQTRH